MRSNKFKANRLWLLGGLVMCLLMPTPFAWAQTTTGTIVGTVLDPTGAAVPGADVTITNTNTAIVHKVRTNGTGQYTVPYLTDGTYDVRVEHSGFRVALVRNVQIVAEVTRRVDIRLQLGRVVQTTEVTVAAMHLQTNNATVGSTIQSQMVRELPLNGRTFAQLAVLVPGVAPQQSLNIATQRNRGSSGTAFAITANGFADVNNGYFLDGVPIRDLDSYDFEFAPSIDAIQEFRVQTNTYSAANGGAPGAQVDVVTKSGTNAFHGTLWEFNRNDALTARSFFDASVPRLNRNQFGGNLGGPIKKNKAFFFFNYDGGRQIQGNPSSLLNVPPPAFRVGDFSAFPGEIIDPTTGKQFVGTPAQNSACTTATPTYNPATGACANVIPTDRIDPTATAFLKYTPLPNLTSGPNNFVTSSHVLPTIENQYDGRVDYNLGTKDTVFGRYIWDRLTTPNEPPVFGNDENNNTATSKNLAANWTHIFGPTFVSNVLVGWNHFFENQVFGTTNKEQYNIACGVLHLPHVACDPYNYGPPTIGAGYTMFNVRANGPRQRENQTLTFTEKNSNQVGNHLLDWGGSLYRENWTFHEVVYARGVYGFDGRQTTPSGQTPEAANAFADYLLGLAHSFVLAPDYFNTYETSWVTNFYFQDNWRVRRNLTVNLGLRWDFFQRPHQRQHTIANFLMNKGGGLIASQKVTMQDRPAGFPSALVYNDYTDWGPRLGFAWTPLKNTVVRAGYGLYYSPEITNSYTNMALNAPFLPFVAVTASENQPILYDNQAAVDALFSGAGALGAFGVNPHLRDSRAHDWNFTVEQQLPSGMLLNVGYVGTHGSRLVSEWDANRAIFPSLPGTPIVRPNPGYGSINMVGSIGTSDYNSLQVQLLRNVGRGLTVMGAYTFSKALGNVDGGDFGSSYDANSGIQDIFHPNLSRSIQSFDVRHRLSATFIYNLPIFQHGTGLKHKVLGGWSTNWIVTEQTGTALGAGYGQDTSNTGVGSLPDMIFNPVIPGGQRTLGEWFNTAAFVPPPPGRFGDAPRLEFHRPGINDFDFELAKTFQVSESKSLVLRGEFFNLFNHPSFVSVNTSLSSPGFGTVTSAGPGRIIQLGMKFYF